MDSKKLIVVTGGAGFIGSAVIRHLNDQGIDNIVVVDQLGCTETWRNLVGKRFVDIIEVPQFFDWLQGREGEIGAFIHLGACSSTVERDASFLLENNYRFTRRLADYALSNDHRFIYASSAATYGDGSQGFSDDHAGLQDLRPLNMYGYSKHLFDLWAQREGVLDKVVGLKYFNVFGPNEYHKGRMSSAVLKMTPQVQQSGKVQLFQSSEPERFGDGEQCRDFIYVKDAARMTCEFLNNDIGGIFNVGSGVANTWISLASGVFTALQLPQNIDFVPMPEDLLGKYQNYTCAEMGKFQKHPALDAHCRPLEDSVVDYVRNYILKEQVW